MGPKRTPIRRGGGNAFGKRPVDWGYRLPRKAVALATRMALLSKFRDNEVTVIDELSVVEPKTRDVAAMFKVLGLNGKTCLLTVAQYDENVYKSARNIAGIEVLPASDLNAYALLQQKQLVLTKAALDKLRVKTADNTTTEKV